jgi:sugar phosphate isomerase/epimerase
MQLIMFTKHLAGLDIPELIEALLSVNVDGADLCVREGYPVTPSNVETALPTAVEAFAAAGLEIPLVTGPTDLTQPQVEYAERLYMACGEAGVKHIKLGYWRWHPGMDYWAEVEKIRGYLEAFQKLSQKSGVQTVIHTHSDAFMGLNASAAMTLVQGFDPQHVGIFADPGHLAIDGEPVDMALAIAAPYLSVVAFKDFVLERVVKEGKAAWGKAARKLGWGLVDWQTAISTLEGMNFAGPISIHAEYDGEPVETVLDITRADVRFVHSLRGG